MSRPARACAVLGRPRLLRSCHLPGCPARVRHDPSPCAVGLARCHASRTAPAFLSPVFKDLDVKAP